MADKSGIAEQIVSLPRGGGAVQAIGETFAPDLQTGTGNLTVPITLPPGRNGLAPQLRLNYSSGSGNGPFGLGWSLSVPGVSRKTSAGLPRYDDAADTFVLSGAEDLVPVPGAPAGAQRYRPRTEGLFARIDHHRGAAGDWWEVAGRDGLVSRYGTERPAGAAADWRDPAAVADPDDPGRAFAWKLTATTDTYGNRIEYRYERDPVAIDGPHRWDQLRLAEIRYVDDDGGQFRVSVRFRYQQRPDPFSDHRAGFEIRTTMRAKRIEIRTSFEQDLLLRTYTFTYRDEQDGGDLAPPNGVSLLARVLVEGHDGDLTQALPPLEFGYTEFEPRLRRYRPLEARGGYPPERSLAAGGYELVDLFGNGLPDVIELDGTARYWRNLGGGVLDWPRAMPDAPAGADLRSSGVQLADANGDGRVDLLVTDGLGLRAGYYSLGSDGGWDRRSWVRYPRAPAVNLEARDVRLVDLNGDGVTDALRTGISFELYYNDRDEGWARTALVPRDHDLAAFPDVTLGDPQVRLADMTGDGLQDVVAVRDGRVDYWPYQGYGRWGARVTMAASPHFEDPAVSGGLDYDPRRVLLGDVDGDGLADLVYVASGHVTVWINQGGNAWSAPVRVDGTPPVGDADAVRLADLDGTGTAGILWTADYDGDGATTWRYLDVTGGVKPYLLDRVDNHRGVTTLVEYVPSTRFYLDDQADPATRWQTTLPFPVQVVARVQTIDELSGGKLTSEFRYRHGYWDGAEREFRGFARVDQRDTEVLDQYNAAGLHGEGAAFTAVPAGSFSPPTELRTWFHLGPVGDAAGGWRELDFSGEYWPGDPDALPQPAATAALLAWFGLDGDRRAQRDAIRTLRGRVLRTELYALDGSDRQGRPYTVTEHRHGVTGLPVGAPWPAPPAPLEGWQRRVFFPFQAAERTTQWERGSDPMTTLGLSDGYDAYGRPAWQLQVAVPRGRDWRQPMAGAAEPYLVTRTFTTYLTRDDDQRLLTDRVAATATDEVPNDGSLAALDLHAQVLAGTLPGRLLARSRSYYDGDPFEGLPLGQLGEHGALMRSERLALTPALLQAAWVEGAPPYLSPGGAVAWTADYPEAFRALLPAEAGYRFDDGQADAAGWWAQTDRRRYDVQDGPGGRGLVSAYRDALGNDTTVAYDRYRLLPVTVTDPAGLIRQLEYDYRVLQPRLATDPNGCRTLLAYTPLGLVERVALLGRDGAREGDTAEQPSVRYTYELGAFDASPPGARQPLSVHTLRRTEHPWALVDAEDRRRAGQGLPPLGDAEIAAMFGDDEAAAHPERFLQSREYSDGFGRLLQTRIQADQTVVDAGLPANPAAAPGDAAAAGPPSGGDPWVVVSGFQVRDNKGRVVEQYEPFFAAGWAWRQADRAGAQVTTTYDPRGRAVRVTAPDGSEQRLVQGVPGTIADPDLGDPDVFEPTPWTAYAYDANDNAGRTHPVISAGYRDHWNTPSSSTVDALGRVVEQIERPGADPAGWLVTRFTHDPRGNLLTVTDPLGRLAASTVYDLLDRPWRTFLLDAGTTRVVRDPLGGVAEQRDAKDALVLGAFEALHRLLRLWARDAGGEPVTLRQRIAYGDGGGGGDRAAAAAAGLLGRVRAWHDEAGLRAFQRYDFKGNPVATTRWVLADRVLTSRLPQAAGGDWAGRAFRVDWEPGGQGRGGTLRQLEDDWLEAQAYTTTASWDALNRRTAVRFPGRPGGESELAFGYGRGGALSSVQLDGAAYLERIDSNARGQRVLVVRGNGSMTRYAYDPATFRLARLRAEGFTQPGAGTWRGGGPVWQDQGLDYDLSGNVLALHDRAPGSGLPATPDALDRWFAYDPLYRLLNATGRECDLPPDAAPWQDTPRCTDLTRTRAYTERYTYDPDGNLTRLRHQADGGGFTRDLPVAPGGNRLATLTVGSSTFAHIYDPCGNLTAETTSRHLEWDHANRLQTFRTQAAGSTPSTWVQYLYDPSGQRVKKLVRDQGGATESTVYLDDLVEHVRTTGTGATTERFTVQVHEGSAPVAESRRGDAPPGDSTPAVKYHLHDRLGSSLVVLDAADQLVVREEYLPYGETSFGGYTRKHWRYSGKSRDDESSLIYFGARYYAPWTCRWVSCDPLIPSEDLNAYQYSCRNPMTFTDRRGTQTDTPSETESAGQVVVEQYLDLVIQRSGSNYYTQKAQEEGYRDALAYRPPGPTGLLTPTLPVDLGRRGLAERQIRELTGITERYDQQLWLAYKTGMLAGVAQVAASIALGGLGQIASMEAQAEVAASLAARAEAAMAAASASGPVVGAELGTFPGQLAGQALIRISPVFDAMAGARSGSTAPLGGAIQGGQSGATTGARILSQPNFVGHPSGTLVAVPEGAVGPLPAWSGQGAMYVGGEGGPGLSQRVGAVRIMEPITEGKYQYPNGYVSYSNQVGQTVNPSTGQTIASSHPMWHIK